MDTSTSYSDVLYRKVEGELVLTDQALTFHPHQNGSSKSNNGNGNTNGSSASLAKVPFGWNVITKHQVSPASHPKHLLKLVLLDGKSHTVQLSNRPDLERVRRDITSRLQQFRANHNTPSAAAMAAASAAAAASISGKKRPHSESSTPSRGMPPAKNGKALPTSFGEMDATALAVTRSSLLAANPSLRAQHHYLVEETETVGEDDFWKTHQDMIEEEYARISGMTKAGTSSLLQSHLQILTGRVTLGVEEMRQIFILYPAVHKAYEEKVPLEHSDEQFWRKYLESEYFHRDRGRIGAASRNAGDAFAKKSNQSDQPSSTGGKKGGMTQDEQEARAAAVGADDLFSRYDQKIRAEKPDPDERGRKWGTHLAVGQFDLASTFETERGSLLEGPKDNHPPSAADDGKGARVIQKYNRHWAMVLHPEDAVAGSNLMQVARLSVNQVLPDDDDAKAGGGSHADMKQLVDFAMASNAEANHAHGKGAADLDDYEELTLKNVEVYYQASAASRPGSGGGKANQEPDEATRKRCGVFASNVVTNVRAMANKVREEKRQLLEQPGGQRRVRPKILDDTFPPPQLGKELLSALTNKMEQDSKTDADALEVVKSLPEDFKKRLHAYFRRSSELLRHFFGLRRLADTTSSPAASQQGATNQKLKRIVQVMETVYREMEGIRKGLEQTETGEIMRKMCLQIMDQLDWAFKLHREGMGGGGGGGFVTIEEF